MTRPKYEWCQTENKAIEWIGWNTPSGRVFGKYKEKLKKTKTYVRCPSCKKRVQCYIRSCHDEGCMHLWMPKHKKRIK
jgi:hypothetical protein